MAKLTGYEDIVITDDLTVADVLTVGGFAVNRAHEVVTAANTITAAESGSTFYLSGATGFASTLPAVALGLEFTVIIGATPPTSGNHTVVPNASNDNTIYGGATVANADVPASAEGSINFVASTAIQGDMVRVYCDGTNWYADGRGTATGAITFTT